MNQDIQAIQSKENLLSAELWISRLLRLGTYIAGSILIIGWILRATLESNLLFFTDSINANDASVIINFGIVILIALPFLRVALSGVIFFLQKDYLYVCLSLTVLIILSFGLIFGKAL